MDLIGYHGTDASNHESIKNNNFNVSCNNDDWLGVGVYFFIDGVSCPIENAREWAVNQAYDKSSHSNKYEYFVVLKARIVLEKVFDTRSDKALNVFNELRNAILDEHNHRFTVKNALHENDKIIWDIISALNKFDGIIHNLYIKNKFQRIKKVHSNVPNATVLCVKDNVNIEVESIEQETSGSVNNGLR